LLFPPPPDEEQESKAFVSYKVSLLSFVISALGWNPKTSGFVITGMFV